MPVRHRARGERSTGDSHRTTGDEALDETFDEPLDEDEDEEPYEDLDEEDLDEDEPVRDRRPGRRSPALSAATAGAAGLRQIADLTAKDTEGVTLVRRTEEGWQVEIEVVEDRHIPSSGDMLSLYQVEMDAAGDLLSYRRVRRYRRGRTDGEAG
ncbi:gas vesicle protein GvpO [Streptosporangium sp. NPDC002721]|uniref:gas vesicle protein GvpO n=1 Tax=Streptosporangium sp. NPDC002721 TaxID=3366188 RepID=UPI003679C986